MVHDEPNGYATAQSCRGTVHFRRWTAVFLAAVLFCMPFLGCAAQEPAADALSGAGREGAVLSESFDGAMAVFTLYGQSRIEDGAARGVESPTIFLHGKNLAKEAYCGNTGQYGALASIDAALLQPGKRYTLSFAATGSETIPAYTGGILFAAEWMQIDNTGARASVSLTINPDHTMDDLARGLRAAALQYNGTDTALRLSDVQIEEDTGAGPSPYEPFYGGTVYLPGIELHGLENTADTLFLDTDGLWKICRRVETVPGNNHTEISRALRVLDQPRCETLGHPLQVQLGALTGRTGAVVGAWSQGSRAVRFDVRPATANETALTRKVQARGEGGFVRVKNGGLVDDNGRDFAIRGVATTDVYNDFFNIHDHAESVYRDMATFGFNASRICISYEKMIHIDAAGGRHVNEQALDRLEEIVGNARKFGMRASIDMHMGPSGAHTATSGPPLFDPENTAVRREYLDVWRAIAKRFADNPSVLAYGLCNEPLAPWMGSAEETLANYAAFLQEAIDAVRQYDQNHIIEIQQLYGHFPRDNPKAQTFEDMGLPDVRDAENSLMYENHWYLPRTEPYGGADFVIEADKAAVASSRYVPYDDWRVSGHPAGQSRTWQPVSAAITLKEGDAGSVDVVLQAGGLDGEALVLLDNIRVRRQSADGGIRDILLLDGEDSEIFSVYSTLSQRLLDGVYIDPEQQDENCYWLTLEEKDGPVHNIILLEDVALYPGETLLVDMDVYSSGATAQTGDIRLWGSVTEYTAQIPGAVLLFSNNKDYLRHKLEMSMDRARQFGVPPYIGELGIGREALNDRAGYEAWAADLAQLFAQNPVGFSWFSAHTPFFGIWVDWEGQPGHISPERSKVLRDYFMAYEPAQYRLTAGDGRKTEESALMDADNKPQKMKAWSLRKKIGAAVLAALVLISVAGFLSGNKLSASHYTLASAKLPAAFDGLRIAHISDLHGYVFGDRQEPLLKEITAFAPDLIFLTGDMVTRRHPEGIKAVEMLLEGMPETAAVYAVTGNHEMDDPDTDAKLRDLYKQYNVAYLDSAYAIYTRDNARIFVYGATIQSGGGYKWVDNGVTPEDPGQYNILLHHFSNYFDKFSGSGFDAAFTGHMHGGLIRLPLIGGIIGADFSLFPPYDAGLYEKNGCTMVCSRGLGNTLVPRIFNNRDLVLVTLKCE
jgi:predicted MPP superfamily phosphohydrolase